MNFFNEPTGGAVMRPFFLVVESIAGCTYSGDNADDSSGPSDNEAADNNAIFSNSFGVEVIDFAAVSTYFVEIETE